MNLVPWCMYRLSILHFTYGKNPPHNHRNRFCPLTLKALSRLHSNFLLQFVCVCVEVLQPSQSNRVMLSTVSLPNHTFTGCAKSSKRLTSSLVLCILLPETDTCPPWISRRERMNIDSISWSISTKEVADPVRFEPTTSWSQVGRASNWAT